MPAARPAHGRGRERCEHLYVMHRRDRRGLYRAVFGVRCGHVGRAGVGHERPHAGRLALAFVGVYGGHGVARNGAVVEEGVFGEVGAVPSVGASRLGVEVGDVLSWLESLMVTVLVDLADGSRPLL